MLIIFHRTLQYLYHKKMEKLSKNNRYNAFVSGSFSGRFYQVISSGAYSGICPGGGGLNFCFTGWGPPRLLGPENSRKSINFLEVAGPKRGWAPPPRTNSWIRPWLSYYNITYMDKTVYRLAMYVLYTRNCTFHWFCPKGQAIRFNPYMQYAGYVCICKPQIKQLF